MHVKSIVRMCMNGYAYVHVRVSVRACARMSFCQWSPCIRFFLVIILRFHHNTGRFVSFRNSGLQRQPGAMDQPLFLSLSLSLSYPWDNNKPWGLPICQSGQLKLLLSQQGLDVTHLPRWSPEWSGTQTQQPGARPASRCLYATAKRRREGEEE